MVNRYHKHVLSRRLKNPSRQISALRVVKRHSNIFILLDNLVKMRCSVISPLDPIKKDVCEAGEMAPRYELLRWLLKLYPVLQRALLKSSQLSISPMA